MILKANAKINLHLQVLPRDTMGYHPIISLFHTVSLHDTLTIKEGGDSGCTVLCDKMALPVDNTIKKVYDEFNKFTKLPPLTVTLEKNIPSGAGLGGPSSDGAAFAIGLETLLGVKMTSDVKKAVERAIGCDSYYFLESKTGAAIVRSHGEDVTPTKKRALFIVLVFPAVHSSTKIAYELLDNDLKEKNNYKNVLYPLAQDLKVVYNGNISSWGFTNSFTHVIAREYSEVQKALDAVKATGALYYNMSGSGACVYGVYATNTNANIALQELINNGWDAVVVT